MAALEIGNARVTFDPGIFENEHITVSMRVDVLSREGRPFVSTNYRAGFTQGGAGVWNLDRLERTP